MGQDRAGQARASLRHIMKMTHPCRGIAILLSLATGACNHVFDDMDSGRITGDSPRDVASSIVRMKARLPRSRQAEFSHAVTTLTLAAPDKKDPRTVGYMSPAFAAMVKGRNPDQIIQLANIFRGSVPLDRGGH